MQRCKEGFGFTNTLLVPLSIHALQAKWQRGFHACIADDVDAIAAVVLGGHRGSLSRRASLVDIMANSIALVDKRTQPRYVHGS